MRSARQEDWYRRVVERRGKWPFTLESLTIEEAVNLGSAEILFPNPLSVICGLNGVGKTSLLRTIWACLDPTSASVQVKDDPRLTAGSVSLSVKIGDEDKQYSYDFVKREAGGDERTIAATYADLSTAPINTLTRIPSDDELPGQKAETAPYRLTEAELKEVGFIVGRDYRAVALYEFEADDPVPYFEVERLDAKYDSRGMGLGELSGFYIWWLLRRQPNDSILLMEEPETFLSPSSQYSILSVISKMVCEKSCAAIVVSHSERLIKAAPGTALIVLSESPQGVVRLDPPPLPVLERLGIDIERAALFLLEDTAGERFFKSVLRRLDANLSLIVATEVVNGEAEITASLKTTRKLTKLERVIGCYDGDQAGVIAEAADVLFLPIDEALEVCFKRLAETRTDDLAKYMAFPALGSILQALEGEDPHEWLEKLASATSLDKGQVFDSIFRIWFDDESNVSKAAEFVSDLSARLN